MLSAWHGLLVFSFNWLWCLGSLVWLFTSYQSGGEQMTASDYAKFVLGRIATGRNEDGTEISLDGIKRLANVAVTCLQSSGEAPLGLQRYMDTGDFPNHSGSTLVH
jgi:hypothetical protein